MQRKKRRTLSTTLEDIKQNKVEKFQFCKRLSFRMKDREVDR